MSVPHAATGEVVNLPALMQDVETYHSRALVKSEYFESMVVQLAKERVMETHNAPAPLIVQGISGTVRFVVAGEEKHLSAGDWMFIEHDAPESVVALEDCSFLLTLLFVK